MLELMEVIESYNEYINKIPKGTMSIANYLRDNQIGEALESIKNFSEGVMWLTHASELIIENKGEAPLAINKIREFLSEINEGLERQDYALVADLFEYEIAPFFEDVQVATGAIQ